MAAIATRAGFSGAAIGVVVGAVASALGAVAVVSPALALAATTALIFVTVAFHNLSAGVALFTVITFFDSLPGVASPVLDVTKAAGVVLVFAALRRRETPLLFSDRSLLAYAALFLVGWAIASTMWAMDAAAAGFESFRLALVVVLFFIVFSAVREPRHVRWIIWGYIAGAVLSALVGVATTSPEPATVDAARLAGGIGDPNYLAALLVPALVFAMFGSALARSAIQRWSLVVCALLFAAALFLTASRGGLVALGVAFVGALVFAGPMRPHAVALIFMVSALGVTYYTLVAPPESFQRITHFGTGSGRTDLWSVAANVFGDHPVAGVGAGNFRVVEPLYATRTINVRSVHFLIDERLPAHNTYLETLAELGVIGFAAFVAVVGGSLALGVRAVRAFARAGDRELEIITRSVIIALIAMLAAFVFLSGQHDKQLWLLLGLATALASLAQRRARPTATV